MSHRPSYSDVGLGKPADSFAAYVATAKTASTAHARSQSYAGVSCRSPDSIATYSHRDARHHVLPIGASALLVIPAMARCDSDSTLSTSTTPSTPPTDRVSSWSTSPSSTSESASPFSPASPALSATFAELEMLVSPSKKPAVPVPASSVASTPTPRAVRPARSSSRTASVSCRFPNTPIEATVPEEGEMAASRRQAGQGQSQKMYRHCVLLPTEGVQPEDKTDKTEAAQAYPSARQNPSNLHQRRQQRKTSTYSPFPQPTPTTLPVLTPLPLTKDASRQTSSGRHRRLSRDASRSLPQLRQPVSPPPTAGLPPLPLVPAFSPLFPPPQSLPTLPPTPAIPPAPSTPPPPPPPPPKALLPAPVLTPAAESRFRERNPLGSIMPARVPVGGRRQKQQQQFQPREQSSSPQKQQESPRKQPRESGPQWEEQLRRHQRLLENFPPGPEQHKDDRLKLSRTYRSLGNLRARARSHTSPGARDDLFPSSGVVHTSSAATADHAPKASHRPQAPLHKMHASLDSKVQLSRPLPNLARPEAPNVSVFEYDSDDESTAVGDDGDTVRRYIRNLFTRRTRSTENASADLAKARNNDSSDCGHSHSNSSHGHNTRRGNHSSSSSSFSSATFSPADTNTTASSASSYYRSNASTVTTPPSEEVTSPGRSSADQTRQRGPLLARMFVRRSH